jgi:hypothetical protein
MTDPFAWLPEAERRLLESYRRIGCSEAEALLAVGGDLLQRSSGPGGDVDPADLQRFLDAAGLSADDVRDALGLRFDATG